jgi:hypothetical protein
MPECDPGDESDQQVAHHLAALLSIASMTIIPSAYTAAQVMYHHGDIRKA